MPENLVKRGRNFSARLMIPVEFQGVIGRNEVVRSLKTDDKKQAVVLLRKLQSGTQRLFFMTRMNMLDRGQLAGILINFIDNEISSLRATGNVPVPDEHPLCETEQGSRYLTDADCNGGLTLSEQYRKMADGLQNDYYINRDKRLVASYAKSVLEDNAIQLNDTDFEKFSDDFSYIYLLGLREIANRLEGNKDFSIKEKVLQHIAEERPVTLKEAVNEWHSAKLSSGRIKKGKTSTSAIYEFNLGTALKFYGEDYQIRKLNNSELQRFVTDQQGRGVKNVTITKRKRQLLDVIKLASANHGFVPHAYKIELSDDSENVPPLSEQELNGMFKHLASKKLKGRWQYWATMVALTTGLRAGEVVALECSDFILSESNVMYLKVRDSKTRAGVRDVPLPDVLLNLGFLNFLNERIASKQLFMFGDWKFKSGFQQVSRVKFSNWFLTFKKKFLSEESLGRLHSLRHNFADALKQGGISYEMRKDLCGHENDSKSAHKHYVEAYRLDMKKEAINKASWECDFNLLGA